MGLPLSRSHALILEPAGCQNHRCPSPTGCTLPLRLLRGGPQPPAGGCTQPAVPPSASILLPGLAATLQPPPSTLQHPGAPCGARGRQLGPEPSVHQGKWSPERTRSPLTPLLLPACLPPGAPAGSTWLCRGSGCPPRAEPKRLPCWQAGAGHGATPATSPRKRRRPPPVPEPAPWSRPVCAARSAPNTAHGAGTPIPPSPGGVWGNAAPQSAALTAALPRGPAVSSK